MKWKTGSSQQKFKIPSTHVHHLIDDQMTLVMRAWGSSEYNQKIIEEISYYLSSAQADLDITSPFDFKENLTSLANKTRVALLLAHDYFYKSVNKSEFSVGFEAVVFFRNKKELAWSGVGRFSLKKIEHNYLHTLFDMGTDRDREILLPVELLGVENDVEINSGSLLISEHCQFLLSSEFQGNLLLPSNGNLTADPNELTQPIDHVKPSHSSMSYWYALVNFD